MRSPNVFIIPNELISLSVVAKTIHLIRLKLGHEKKSLAKWSMYIYIYITRSAANRQFAGIFL